MEVCLLDGGDDGEYHRTMESYMQHHGRGRDRDPRCHLPHLIRIPTCYGEYNGVNFVKISRIFAMQETFFIRTAQFDSV